MVAQRPLEPPVQVRVLAPQPLRGRSRRRPAIRIAAPGSKVERQPALARGTFLVPPSEEVVDDGLGA